MVYFFKVPIKMEDEYTRKNWFNDVKWGESDWPLRKNWFNDAKWGESDGPLS